MKIKHLYNLCLTAVAEGMEDFEVVISEVHLIPDDENVDESYIAVTDNPTVMLDIDEETKEFRIFGMQNTPELLDAYEGR